MKRLFVTVYFYVMAVLYVFFYGGFVLVRARFMRDRVKARAYVLSEIEKFGRRAFSWLFSKVVVEGEENVPKDKNVVVVANHQSLMDIPLILGFVKTGAFIAKKELKKIPGINWYIDYLGGVYLDRSDPKRAVRAIREVMEKLKQGVSFVLFPEGTRSPTGEVLPFKQDSLMIAYRTGTPVLPIAIWGTYHMIPKGRFLFSPQTVYLRVLPPVDPSRFSSEAELREHVEGLIREHIEILKKRWEDEGVPGQQRHNQTGRQGPR